MARAAINLGVAPTGQGGDTFRTASQKNNDNSAELYAALGAPVGTGAIPAALPVAKGGTGSTTAAGARTALDLERVSSSADVTPGRLVTPGWMGWGTAGGLLLPGANASQELPSGLYYTTPTWTGSPFAGNDPRNRGYLMCLPWGQAGYQSQQFSPLSQVANNPIMFRTNVNGAWGPWDPIITSISSGTDPALALGGLLSSSVVNGYSIFKFSNGDAHIIGPAPTSASVGANSIASVSVTVPSIFISTNYSVPSISITGSTNSDHYGTTNISMSTATTVQLSIRNGATAQTFSLVVSVWGRWK